MEFPEHPENPPGGWGQGDVPGHEDMSFEGLPDAGQVPADEVPPIFAHPDAGGNPETGEGVREAASTAGDLNVPTAETVLDMSEPERQAFQTELERFAASGERYREEYSGIDQDGQPRTVVNQGYIRHIPRGALVAEGLPYDNVSVNTIEGEDGHYSVGMSASRRLLISGSLPIGPNGSTISVPVPTVEEKLVGFEQAPASEGASPPIEMHAHSHLFTPQLETTQLPEGVEPPEGYEGEEIIAIGVSVDRQTPLLRRDEVDAVVRAMGRADEFSNEEAAGPRPDLPRVALDILAGQDSSDIELPQEGEAVTDLPQPGRAALMDAIDRYARSGTGVQQSPTAVSYQREIPADILRAHDVIGSAAAVVIEDTSVDFYRVSLAMTHPIVGVSTETEGSPVMLSGRREAYLSVFSVAGTRRGGSSETSGDLTGGTGLHLRYVGVDRYQTPDGRILPLQQSPPMAYEEARNAIEALRAALRDAEL